jgi:hypothetical protein
MHRIFDRNIRNSMLVTGGEFESALADVIDQLEHPPRLEDRSLSVWETTRLIADAMREGFAGLPPNGFEFSCWLWESAPLHMVHMPHANNIGTSRGYRYGVQHLRKIAAIIVGGYIREQPKKAPAVIELIDVSIDWVDARNLISHALLEHYDQYFVSERGELEQLARSPLCWRRLIPLGVSARIIGMRPADSAIAWALVRLACTHAADAHVRQAMLYVLRIAALYGDRVALLDFLASLGDTSDPVMQELICDFLRNPRLQWGRDEGDAILGLLRQWKIRGSSDGIVVCIDRMLEHLESLVPSA